MTEQHDIIVKDWHENAQKHDEANYLFLRSLKMRPAKKVDRLARRIHLEVFERVDCTRCANCCRTLRPVFTEEDIDRIAAHRATTREDFIATYLEWNKEENRHQVKTNPCPLLGNDNKCTVYDVRPVTCKSYPYTDKPNFSASTMTRAMDALVCPAAFRIVEEMKKKLG